LKIKADENLAGSGVEYLRDKGHDVATVREQGLGGASDEAIYTACLAERRTLVTFDRDFGNILRFWLAERRAS
jgi:predicted nuclease of predicted toxin-antitoxin system